LTFDLNQGPFRYLQAVVILLSGHGHVLWFPFTALAGSLMVLALGSVLRGLPWLAFLGQNGLILLGMNGFFYHFVNKPLAAWSAGMLPGSGLAVFLTGLSVTIVSIAACVPVIFVLNRAVPQLVGKPRQTGLFFGPFLKG